LSINQVLKLFDSLHVFKQASPWAHLPFEELAPPHGWSSRKIVLVTFSFQKSVVPGKENSAL